MNERENRTRLTLQTEGIEPLYSPIYQRRVTIYGMTVDDALEMLDNAIRAHKKDEKVNWKREGF
jgi:hypothetical protein